MINAMSNSEFRYTESSCETRRRKSVSRAIAYIETAFREELSLEGIAAQAHFSKFHFARVFRAETGVSPLQYVRQRRILEAERMLLSGDNSLLRIASDLGYFDHSHFCRAFKLAKGLSPQKFILKYRSRAAAPCEIIKVTPPSGSC